MDDAGPARRVAARRDGMVAGFAKTYGVTMLVYFEEHESVLGAMAREKRVKRWEARDCKIAFIRKRAARARDDRT